MTNNKQQINSKITELFKGNFSQAERATDTNEEKYV